VKLDGWNVKGGGKVLPAFEPDVGACGRLLEAMSINENQVKYVESSKSKSDVNDGSPADLVFLLVFSEG